MEIANYDKIYDYSLCFSGMMLAYAIVNTLIIQSFHEKIIENQNSTINNLKKTIDIYDEIIINKVAIIENRDEQIRLNNEVIERQTNTITSNVTTLRNQMNVMNHNEKNKNQLICKKRISIG